MRVGNNRFVDERAHMPQLILRVFDHTKQKVQPSYSGTASYFWKTWFNFIAPFIPNHIIYNAYWLLLCLNPS
jgi:hypothetical protein